MQNCANVDGNRGLTGIRRISKSEGMEHNNPDDLIRAAKVLALSRAEFPDVLVTHIQTLVKSECLLFRFSLSGKSTTEELKLSYEVIDEDRACDLRHRILLAVGRVRWLSLSR